ncbi:MAG: winged helix-turn-helix transcriptional regulator [Candidatus Doudnabacteria bacterium]|nr:winged helix-turn-helix transcriptional regulator [Candidatus Doudnabacteria bacterium]
MNLKKNTEEIVGAFLAVFRELKKKLSYGNPLFHLPLAQMEALRFVHETKQPAMKEISDHFGITPPSATALINHLVNLGYVTRIANGKDRRGIRISLTAKGLNIFNKASKQHCQRLEKLLSKLSEKEKQEFLKILNKMIN